MSVNKSWETLANEYSKDKMRSRKEYSRVAAEISEFLNIVSSAKGNRPLVIYYGSTRMQINSDEEFSIWFILNHLAQMKEDYTDNLIHVTEKDIEEINSVIPTN